VPLHRVDAQPFFNFGGLGGRIGAVTPEDVQAVAKKYLDPKTLAIVACGPIDKDGKPLAPKK